MFFINGEEDVMRNKIMIGLRTIGTVVGLTTITLLVTYLASFCYTFIGKAGMRLPYGLFESVYQTTASGGFGIEIAHHQYFIVVIMVTMFCLTLLVSGIKKIKHKLR